MGIAPQQHIESHLPHFFIPPPPTEYQQFTTCPSSKHKKIAPFIFTFATLVSNEDKHRNQAGITKLRVPRFSTALSFAVPPWLPVGIACTSTLPISNPIAAPSDREVPLLVPPLMRTGLLALAPFTFLFGIAFTARCKAMLFAAPLRFASAALRGMNATSVSKERQVTKRKSPARTFRRSVLEVRTVGVTL